MTDQILAKYEQLDSGEYRAVGTPAFNAEACELANLLACVQPTLPETEPADSKGIIQAYVFQALKTLFRSKLHWAGSLFRVWRMQLCSHRYVRITGVAVGKTLPSKKPSPLQEHKVYAWRSLIQRGVHRKMVITRMYLRVRCMSLT